HLPPGEEPAPPGPSPPSPLSHTHSHPPGRGGTHSVLFRVLGGGAPLPGEGSACGRGDGGEGYWVGVRPRNSASTPASSRRRPFASPSSSASSTAPARASISSPCTKVSMTTG